MRRTISISLLSLSLLVGCSLLAPRKATNPDPNHIHADFAVWIGGRQLDFADATYMSGSSTDEGTHPTEGPRKYVHLHDGNGQVIHSHKPGQRLNDFFASIDFSVASEQMHLYVNGKEFLNDHPLLYVFKDGDHLLLTDTTDPAELQSELAAMTDDACLYSQTCPQRGKPPVENCIADPAVPCTE